MIASVWTALVDVALGAIGAIVAGLVAVVWRLAERVTRLEASDDERRRLGRRSSG